MTQNWLPFGPASLCGTTSIGWLRLISSATSFLRWLSVIDLTGVWKKRVSSGRRPLRTCIRQLCTVTVRPSLLGATLTSTSAVACK